MSISHTKKTCLENLVVRSGLRRGTLFGAVKLCLLRFTFQFKTGTCKITGTTSFPESCSLAGQTRWSVDSVVLVFDSSFVVKTIRQAKQKLVLECSQMSSAKTQKRQLSILVISCKKLDHQLQVGLSALLCVKVSLGANTNGSNSCWRILVSAQSVHAN